MALRQYSLLGFVITLIVTLTGKSSVAFTINYPPPDGRSDAFIRYNEPNYEGEAYLYQFYVKLHIIERWRLWCVLWLVF